MKTRDTHTAKSSDSLRTRRRFLGQASCAAVTATPLLSTLLNLKMTGSVAAADGVDYRALVCVFLAGGQRFVQHAGSHGILRVRRLPGSPIQSRAAKGKPSPSQRHRPCSASGNAGNTVALRLRQARFRFQCRHPGRAHIADRVQKQHGSYTSRTILPRGPDHALADQRS